MEFGILAAIIILSIELIIIVCVIAFLFYKSKRKGPKTAIPENGEYNKNDPESVTEAVIVDEEQDDPDDVQEKKSVHSLKSVSSEETTKLSPEGSSNNTLSDSASEIPEPPLVESLVTENDVIQSKSPNHDEADSRIIEIQLTPSLTRELLLDESKKINTESSSDEGVGDIEKRTLSSESSSNSSSSSSSEDEGAEVGNVPDAKEGEQDDEEVTTNVEAEEPLETKASSSSSSSSEDEKESNTNMEKVEEIEYTTADTLTAPVETRDSSLHTLENGITLSLRLDQQTAPEKSSSSSASSSTSSSSEDEGVKVIRTYDRIPSNDSKRTNDLALVYDPIRHTVVDMSSLKMSTASSSSSSDSEQDESFPASRDEVVAGIINVTSGEKLTISQAILKGLIPEKTGMLLLEAQAATGSVVNPRTGVKLSVIDAIKKGVVDSRYKVTLSASEGAYYGYLDPRKNESVPLYEAMRRGIFPRAQGMRLLEAQVATGGIIDPWTGSRYPLASALRKGLIDQSTAKVLRNPEDHADFFDPNTKQRFSYGDILSKCIRDFNTGLKFLYIEEKPRTNTTQYQPDLLTFRSAFRRKVSFQELIDAGLVDRKIMDQFNKGQIGREELREKLKPFLVGEQPIAGIYNRSTKEVLTISQAVRSGLVRRSHALELLEAQAATGNMIDPKSGQQMSVSRAISIGLVDRQFAFALRKAELAVLGYQPTNSNTTISLFEAMKRGLVIEVQGIRLLDAQMATGGLIDPVGGYRIPVSVAMSRGMFDQRLADALAHPTFDQKGYYDPNTGEHLSYSELLRRCVIDKKKNVGMRLLPVNDRGGIKVISNGQTRSRKIIIMDPKTRRPLSLKQAVGAKIISAETARRLVAKQGSWIEK